MMLPLTRIKNRKWKTNLIHMQQMSIQLKQNHALTVSVSRVSNCKFERMKNQLSSTSRVMMLGCILRASARE